LIIKQPLLTIAIPTWNRSFFLEQLLDQLYRELEGCDPNSVEVLVSDNFSSDNTSVVIEQVINKGLKLRYIRNNENIGSDANIAQCFNLATGKYVLILGDDDLFVDGALSFLLHQLKSELYGVVCLRPYGFNKDFRQEQPGSGGTERVYMDAGSFLAVIGSLMTLISACVVHKAIIPAVDARNFCGENLVQVHLVIRAALASEQNLFLNKYLIACKRNNSGGYDFSEVFVENLGSILDSYQGLSLSKKAILAIETRLMIGYLPYYLFKQRLVGSGDIVATYDRFHKRYKGRWCFYLWIYPILKWPRLLAIMWGAMATIIGRILNGDLIRGIFFALNKVFR
jgi:glycosyltransferase involved in cell wall biosynthesis